MNDAKMYTSVYQMPWKEITLLVKKYWLNSFYLIGPLDLHIPVNKIKGSTKRLSHATMSEESSIISRVKKLPIPVIVAIVLLITLLVGGSIGATVHFVSKDKPAQDDSSKLISPDKTKPPDENLLPPEETPPPPDKNLPSDKIKPGSNAVKDKFDQIEEEKKGKEKFKIDLLGGKKERVKQI